MSELFIYTIRIKQVFSFHFQWIMHIRAQLRLINLLSGVD